MKLFGDWKFFLTLVITVAGVAVPVWLWQSDLSSKSLSVRLITLAPLQPKEQNSLSGMEMSIGGVRLEKPYLVVFEIQNDGSKPIPATDFESPLDIRIESDTTFVRSEVTDKNPKDIEAAIISERQRISLKPTLLNTKDKITITAITSGAPPIFGTKARIMGISNVSLEDGTNVKTSRAKLALLLSGAVLCFVALSLMVDVVFSKGIFLRRRAAVFIGFVSAMPGVIALSSFLEEIGIQGFWYSMMYYMLLMIPVKFMASALNRKQKSPEDGLASD